MVDSTALYMIILRYVVIILAVYVIGLLVLRMSKYYRLTRCPVCGEKLSRHRRTAAEKRVARYSFGLLPVKRYRCYSCYWEGQAFEIPKDEIFHSPKQ
jgi:uncharacterized protein with PIN domain